ncbi:MAG: YbgC/FadM family acyl-CoA thioesterase [Desulforhopalus sp.]|nr:YbgC/FadM family acyl-CoA thioesterase [Desulforhopalus sp.]
MPQLYTSPHALSIRIIYADTDAAGVVYHANYLRYFESGRTEFMRDRICSGREFAQYGIVLVVTESWMRYKAPAFYDDLIIVETILTSISRVKCQFSYRVLRNEGERRKLLVKGCTDLAPVTREGRLTRIPVDLVNRMTPLLQGEFP